MSCATPRTAASLVPRFPATSFRHFAVILSLGALMALPASASTLVVDLDGTYDANTNDCDGADPSYTGIPAAVADAIDGDTVFVCPGTYVHPQIIVNKRITLQGSGADVTIIDGNGGFGISPFGMIRLVPVAGTGNVVFDGFTVQNPPATTNDAALRVNLFAASAFDVNITVTNNVIIGSGNPVHNLNYTVYAAGPIGGQPAIDNFVFQHNEVRDAGSNSILIERHVGPTDVSFNKLDRGVRAPQGITSYVNMSHTGSVITSLQRVSYNTIDMANDPGPYTVTNSSSAIAFLAGLTGVTVGNYTNVEIVGNTIINLESYRRGIVLSNNITTLANTANGTISNALISCNSMSGPAGSPQEGSIGIRLVGNIPSPTISNNSMDSVDIGFRAENPDNGVATGVILNENSFIDTDSYAVDWRSIEVIDAERNWWGSDTGPTDPANPGGTGGVIGASGGPMGSGVIDFSPWLASAADADVGPCFVPDTANECRTVGICDEIDGCSDSPLPDGTPCGGGLYTCLAGECDTTVVLLPMVLNRANLRSDTPSARAAGRASVVGLINDNDTQGDFEAALLSNSVTVQITDAAAFDATRTLTNCVAGNNIIRCRSNDRLTRAIFRFRPPGPYLYMMRATFKNLNTAEAALTAPVGPVTVVLDQGVGTRSDVIGDFTPCALRGQRQLVCRER